jgi:hypothetical protein
LSNGSFPPAGARSSGQAAPAEYHQTIGKARAATHREALHRYQVIARRSGLEANTAVAELDPAKRKDETQNHNDADQGCTLLSGMIAPWKLVPVCLALKSLAAESREERRSAAASSPHADWPR